MVHRICYLMYHGKWPDTTDHINRVKDDNRIENLRSVTNEVNMKNLPKYSNNTEGRTGIYYMKKKNRWKAEITVDNVRHYLGLFKTKDEAIAAREEAELRFGFMTPS